MKSGLAFTTLLAGALVAAPSLSRADETRWESLHVYTLSGGNPVAVAVPSEWSPVATGSYLGEAPALRFRDRSGTEFAIPVAALEHASAEKRLFRPDLARRVARNER